MNIVIGQGSFHSPLGWCEKRKFGKLYCPQMKLNACHKNFKNAPIFTIMHLKKLAAPLKVKNYIEKIMFYDSY